MLAPCETDTFDEMARGEALNRHIQARVAVLCQELSRWPKLRERIEAVGGGAKLDELLTAVAQARQPSDDEHIRTLLDAVAQIGDQIEMPFLTTELRGPVPRLPGTPAPGGQIAWVCPDSRCLRVELVEEVSEAPSCEVASGARLRPYPFRSTGP